MELREVRAFMRSRRRLVAVCLLLALGSAVIVTVLRSSQPPLYRVTILPTLGGSHTVAHAINDRGQVVGVSERADGSSHLFLWDRENGMRDLGPVVNDLVQINGVGQIVATMRDPNDNNRAFVWGPNSGRRVLPTLGGGTMASPGGSTMSGRSSDVRKPRPETATPLSGTRTTAYAI